MDDFEFTPAPVDVAQRINSELIEQGIASFLDGDELAALFAGRLRWVLDGFDGFGLGRVTVTTDAGAVVGTVDVHWSVIVREVLDASHMMGGDW